MAWERDTALKGLPSALLCSALLIASPCLGSVSDPHSHVPAAAGALHQQVQSSQNLKIRLIQVRQQLHTRADAANITLNASRAQRRACVFAWWRVWLQWMTELAAKIKQVKNRRAENVCYCGNLRRLYSWHNKHHGGGTRAYTCTQHTRTHARTSRRDPVSTARCLTGAHMQNTPTRKLYMHTGRETNCLPLKHCGTPGSGPYGLNHQHSASDSRFKVQSSQRCIPNMINLVPFFYHADTVRSIACLSWDTRQRRTNKHWGEEVLWGRDN